MILFKIVLSCFSLLVFNIKSVRSCRPQKPICDAVSFYGYWNSTINDHFYTTTYQELGGDWKSEGVQCRIYPCHQEDTVPLYEYWGHNNHFYTTNSEEIGTTTPGEVGKLGYKSEGIAGYCYPRKIGNSVPLYRYYNLVIDHFYTTNSAEIGTTEPGTVGRNGYIFEGIACYVLH